MKDALSIGVSILTLLTLASGLYLAVVRFGIHRERATFLHMAISSTVVAQGGEVALLTVTIQLDNRGDTRIDARRHPPDEKGAAFLYDDTWDQCTHAGTLKVRPIPPRSSAVALDWYALPVLPATLERCRVTDRPHQVAALPGDLEQINYLGDYQDPTCGYRDVDFWLEPHETYEVAVPLWLPSGQYAVKAYFLGPNRRPKEEEYWSCTGIFEVPVSTSQPPNTLKQPDAARP